VEEALPGENEENVKFGSEPAKRTADER